MEDLKERIAQYSNRDPGDENDFDVQKLADGFKLVGEDVADPGRLDNYGWMDEDGTIHDFPSR